MNTIPFWAAVDLKTESRPTLPFKVSLEDMVSGTGRLVEGELSSYAADGVRFQPGDVLFGKLRPYLAKYWLADRDGTAGGDIHVYRPNPNIEPRFLSYFVGTDDFVRYAEAASKGTKMPRVEWMNLRNFAIPCFPTDDQRRIADYLDRETAEIDAMDAELDRLVETLRERAADVITRTVQGSAKHGAPTDDSMYTHRPFGWSHPKLMFVCARITDGAHISPELSGGTYDFVSTKDVKNGEIDFDSSLKTSPASYDYMVRTGCQPVAGDVLFSKDGTVGETAVVRENREFVVASSLVIISPDPSRLDSEYLRYALRNRSSQEEARTFMRGAGLPRLSVANLGRVRIPLPPLGEQRRIVTELDEQTARIDETIADAQRLKALLAERRSTLITEVVTGRKEVPA